MAEVNKRQYKDLDKRITEIKEWIDEEKSSLSDRNLIANYSFLITAMENYQEAMEGSRTQMSQLQSGMAENYQLVQEFVEKEDKKEEWESFIYTKREEAQKKFDEENDPNFALKQRVAKAEAEAEEKSEDEETKD